MTYIRSPVATKLYSRRQYQLSRRCLVATLGASFIVFSYLVFYTFNSSVVSDPHVDPPSSASITEHTWKGPAAHSSFKSNPDWINDWFRWRGLNPGPQDLERDAPKFDIVYTWVNGSDPKLQRLRQEYQRQSAIFAHENVGDAKSIETLTTKRFRDMDELRYSVRSVAEYAKDMYRQVHLLATEVELGQGQRPDWLSSTMDVIRPVNHRIIFQNSSHLPSFNSLAIESQIHHIPGLTDIFMYLNDDVFLGTTMLGSDIWTELYGFVFHMEGSLLVPPTIRPTESNPLNVGEWSSLQYSNYLLSQRFGPRYRAYLAHVPHVLSVSILKEIQEQWPKDFDSTSSHRFRGEGEARDVQVSFFMAHYVLEKLRETQLESYWLHRLDANQDGVLDWNERKALIQLVQGWNQNQQQGNLKTRHSRPTMIAGHDQVLKRIGVPLSGSTTYQLAGLDGYPFLLPEADTSRTIPVTPFKNAEGNQQQPQKPYMRYERPQTRTCRLDLAFCFGSEFLDPNFNSMPAFESKRIFNRLAFEEFHCGDCLLEVLMQHGDTGMGAWMPLDENSDIFKEVARKVARYNYVLGTSDYSFMALQGPEGSQKNLDNLLAAKDRKAFFCINDDFPDDPALQSQILGIFKSFLDRRFPTPSPWEKQ